MILTVAALVDLAAPASHALVAVQPNAARLQADSQCFAINRAGTAVGKTLQTVGATKVGRRAAWEIVVHQRLDNGSFDMRDHFVVDRATLLPIAFDSQRGTDRDARGWQRVVLRYEAGRVVGTRETKDGVTAIDVALDGPVWDGNLWGITFASLPLRVGGEYTLPYWQYDKGRGTFKIKVVGREQADVRGGKTDAWIIEAGDDPVHLSRYVVGARRPMEIGYSAGPFGQKLGGDCSGLSATEAASLGTAEKLRNVR